MTSKFNFLWASFQSAKREDLFRTRAPLKFIVQISDEVVSGSEVSTSEACEASGWIRRVRCAHLSG